MDIQYFTSKKVWEDTWLITSHGSTSYLCAGKEEALVIDTGDSYGNLREYTEQLCKKPVRMVLNTHGHFDHTGLNGYFDRAYLGRLAAEIAREPNGGQPIERYPMDYEIVTVDDGFVLDIGGRKFEAIRMDGHSPDSIAWLDLTNRILFTGDNLAGMVPLNYKCVDPQPSMLLYMMSVAKLLARRDEYDLVGYGHGRELVDADIVNHAMMAALRALDGETDPADPPHPRPKEDGVIGPVDVPPDLTGHDPADDAFVRYKDVQIMFNKRYLKDATRYDIVKGT
ncbi:MAG: MBL fold metallo-hydrolase [Clostridiales bacterium]|nr:MBL fold metallo-hydrolase [Clostridiales bacterium]